MTYLITGAAGFIGSHLVKYIRLVSPSDTLVLLDAMTYAGNIRNIENIVGSPNVAFIQGSITDDVLIERIMEDHAPDVIINVAAETHVDRSIHGFSVDFVMTNVRGTHVLLEAARRHQVKKFVQVSTDEVYGTLALDARERFNELSPISPNSPYAASKASADLLCRSYFETYGLPVVITRCTNNFGSHQFPEKMIPYWITRVMRGKKIPLYGDGKNVRDWIHVNDHVNAIWLAAQKGVAGQVYNVGIGNEQSNEEIASFILEDLGMPADFVRRVPDRLGHDRRYALDASKLYRDLGFVPEYPRARFREAIRETVVWYKENFAYIEEVEAKYGTLNPHIPEEPTGHIAIFGSGMLGGLYKTYFESKNFEVTVIKTDVRNAVAVREDLKDKPYTAVLNCVAKTDIDWCERNKQETIAVNTLGADNIAAACQEFGLYLVHVSSGCIQESRNETQIWKETDEVSPVCFYAWTKVFADTLILDRARRHGLKALILRPRQLLTATLNARNALTKMLTYSKFIDTPNSCTVIDDLLDVTLKLMEKKATGVFNIANPGITSPYRIALMLRDIIKPEMNVTKISKEELNAMTYAQRIDSVLSIEKLLATGITLPSIETRLPEIIRDLKHNLSREEAGAVMAKVEQDTKEKLALREMVL